MYKLTNNGFIIRVEDNAFIPIDTANADYNAYLIWVSNSNTAIPADTVTAIIPQSVTRLQALLALNAAGLLTNVKSAVAVSDMATQLAFDNASTFDRDSPFMATMATALNLTSDQLDALFTSAATFN